MFCFRPAASHDVRQSASSTERDVSVIASTISAEAFQFSVRQSDIRELEKSTSLD